MDNQPELPVNFFISHNLEAAQLAGGLIKILKLAGGRRIRVCGSFEGPLDLDRFRWVLSRLREARVFLLLLTEPYRDVSHDLCFYELGLFTGLEGADNRRVVCLYNTELEPLTPLHPHFQAIPAEPESVERFIRELFGGTAITGAQKPVNLEFARDRKITKQTAQEFCTYFRPPLIRHRIARFVNLTIRDPSRIDGKMIPGNARIEADVHSLLLLGLTEREWTWQEFMDSTLEGNQRWSEELAKALYDARTGRVIRQPHASFLSPLDRKRYRFVLGEFSSSPEGTWRFHLNLVEDSVPEEGAIFGPPRRDGSWPDVFMLMPFEPELEPVFRDHVVNVASELRLKAGRGDDLFSNRSIVQDIWSAIYNARVVIADCTGRNANVFYEIGIAHSIGKDTVLIAQNMEDVPFDLQHLRVIIYKFTPRGMHEFESKLKTALKTIASGESFGAESQIPPAKPEA